MKHNIKKVAILGTGEMGRQIAAHFANVDVAVLAFDTSQKLAQENIKRLLNLEPQLLFESHRIEYITPCNYKKHLERLKEVDWVIEAVVEELTLKQALFRRVFPLLKSPIIISSTTSGIPLKQLCQGMPGKFKEHFLITQFFNPIRYMPLVEVVLSENLRPEILVTAIDFCENIFGKEIIYAEDTPNFIANHIGIYAIILALHLADTMQLSIEEVDQLSGSLIGGSSRAVFATLDMLGVDNSALLVGTMLENWQNEKFDHYPKVPNYLQTMIAKNYLGNKVGQGFYKKEKNIRLSLMLKNLEYVPVNEGRFKSLQSLEQQKKIEDRIRLLAYKSNIAGKFIWEMLVGILSYTANCIPKITKNIIDIDHALKWGWGWHLGPFEIWDALGVKKSLSRMSFEKKEIPEWVEAMLVSGCDSFYSINKECRCYFDTHYGEIQQIPSNKKSLELLLLDGKKKRINKYKEADLIDLGDGVLCVEFHSTTRPAKNILNLEIMAILENTLKIIKRDNYKGLLIANQGANFSAGIDLQLLLNYCKKFKWQKIEKFIKQFQNLCQKLRYAPFPVVAVPFNLTLDMGLEIAMACDRVVASVESYCGLSVLQSGLLPAGGGSLRMLANLIEAMREKSSTPLLPVKKAFENIFYQRISVSAPQAITLGYLTPKDSIIMNAHHLVYQGKQMVLKMAGGYTPPKPLGPFLLPGNAARLDIEAGLEKSLKEGILNSYDLYLAKQLAYVLTGGEHFPSDPLNEQAILRLERKAFLTLCKEPQTQERMAYMFKQQNQ